LQIKKSVVWRAWIYRLSFRHMSSSGLFAFPSFQSPGIVHSWLSSPPLTISTLPGPFKPVVVSYGIQAKSCARHCRTHD
jgi:hypothetical protein